MNFNGLNVQLKEFKKSLRGYDVSEVKNYLEQVSQSIENIVFENKVLKDKLREKELVILDFKEREATLKETMVTAQKVTESIKKDATRESLHIITQAKVKADGIIREARQNVKNTIDEINRLKKMKSEITSKLKATLESHLSMLDQYKEDSDLIKINLSHNSFPTKYIEDRPDVS